MKQHFEKYRIAIIFAVILIILIAGAVAIYINHQKNISENNLIWKGPGGEYRIEKQQQGALTVYITTIDYKGQKLGYPFRNSPSDVKDITVQTGVLSELLTKQGIYITKDSNLSNLTQGDSTLSAISFGEILGSGQFGLFQRPVKSAFTDKFDETNKIPQITCQNVTKNVAVVDMKLGEENKIYFQDKCIILEATDGANMIKTSERLAYGLLGLF